MENHKKKSAKKMPIMWFSTPLLISAFCNMVFIRALEEKKIILPSMKPCHQFEAVVFRSYSSLMVLSIISIGYCFNENKFTFICLTTTERLDRLKLVLSLFEWLVRAWWRCDRLLYNFEHADRSDKQFHFEFRNLSLS